MAVRNLEEIGVNAQAIIKALLANQNLMKLLYYGDKDPLAGEDLTQTQIKKEVYQKLVKIVPRIGNIDTAQSIIAMRIVNGYENPENQEIRDVKITFEVFTPLTSWIIKDSNLRPFAIMGEIQKSLDGLEIKGFGTLSGGGFSLNFLTDSVSDYMQTFNLQTYD